MGYAGCQDSLATVAWQVWLLHVSPINSNILP